ncbi:MAG: Asp-tRNA(Asn)/Glu-tRNA(Gln) amidotransferase subunit GatC [Candidatus Bathyarchaeota archaeon]
MKKQHLSKKDVEHVALLAHVEISDKEKILFTNQFNDILDYFKKIDSIDTEGINPTYHVLDINNVTRKDEPDVSLTIEEALQNAPKKEKRFFKAPRIV